MVKVTAPCMSESASGSLGKTLVFARWKGRQYVRSLVRPQNPKSPGQVTQRAMLALLVKWWTSKINDLAMPVASSWTTLAKQIQASTFNAFCKHNLLRWSEALTPIADPTASAGTDPAISTGSSATAGVKDITLALKASATAIPFAWMIYRDTSTITTPTKDMVIGFALNEHPGTTDPTTYVDGPLTPDTYYYVAIPIGPQGEQGTGTAVLDATIATPS